MTTLGSANQNNPNPLFEAAKQYATRQWPVLPLIAKEKRPLTPKGFKNASTVDLQINLWWSQYSNANIGIRTGAKPEGAGILVVDIDKAHGGFESLAKLEQEHGKLPATVEAVSGSGGRHFYFRYPEGIQLGNSTGRLGEGIDTRGDGGYIVAPPSVHPCGESYVWEEGQSPEQIDLAEIPAWMIQKLDKSQSSSTTSSTATPGIFPGDISEEAALAPMSLAQEIGQQLRDMELNLIHPYTPESLALGEMYKIKPHEGENDGSRRLYAWACRAVEYDLEDATALELIRLTERTHPLPKPYSDAEIYDRLRDAGNKPEVVRGSKRRLVLDAKAPLQSVREFVRERFIKDGLRTLHCHQERFLAWKGSHYVEVSESQMEAQLYDYANHALGVVRGKDREMWIEPFNPDDAKIKKLSKAMKAWTMLPDDTAIPSWISDGSLAADPDPSRLVVMKNGLFDMENGKLLSHTPRFLNVNALTFDYLPEVEAPKEWIKFLHDLWGNDPELIRLLQQWFGYCLTCDTSQQKILMMVGPKRSGKGTIARVLTKLLGEANVVSLTLSSLGQNFGLSPAIDKTLAVIPEARLSGSNQSVITERLLSISGEDSQYVDRKYQSPWNGPLKLRLMLMTNELPKLTDASGALASRFLMMQMTQSFYNREDRDLDKRLFGELPGIFNWAVQGWRDLQQQGRFVQPQSSLEMQQEMEELSSPIQAFIRDYCVIGVKESVMTHEIYDAWRRWCDDQGRNHPGNIQSLGRDLRAAVPSIAIDQLRNGHDRCRLYRGIGLRSGGCAAVTRCHA